jgi:uncharacterized protein YjiS (DUF1127 family)
MPQASRQTTEIASAVSFFELLSDRAARLLVQVQKRRKLARDRRVLDQLSDAQLKDVGIDRWAIRPLRPTIEVESGLMTKLMSMR